MKLQWLLFFTLAIAQVKCGIANKQFKSLTKTEECAEKLHLDVSKMPDLFRDFYPVYEDNEEHSKFLACLWNKKGIIETSGKINQKVYDNFVRKILEQTDFDNEQKGFSKNALGRCKNIKGDSPGITGIRLKNCFSESIIEIYSSIARDQGL